MQSKTGLSSIATAVKLLLAAVAVGVAGAAAAQVDSEQTRVIVSFKKGKGADMRKDIGTHRGRVKQDLAEIDSVAIEISKKDLDALRKSRHVESIEEDAIRYPFATTSPSTGTPYLTGQLVPYGIPMVQADQLSDVNAGNRKICIIDSGYDRNHEDLGANVATGEYDSGTGWWYTDENHHGTTWPAPSPP